VVWAVEAEDTKNARACRSRADYVVPDLNEMLYGLGPNQVTGTYDYCYRHAAPDSSTSITLNRQSTDRRSLGRGGDYTALQAEIQL
jgi:hypothetical protein